MCAAVPQQMTLTGAWGRMRNRFVGRGILDASMAHSVRGRQGCRPLRPGWSMVRTSGGTRRSRPTSGTVVCSWFGGNGKAAVHHPVRGWGRRPCGIRRGDCAICGWRFGTIGYFAPCAGRPEALPLDSAILGCPPSVGKSGRRGILRQAKVWIRSHTGCMARNRTAGMAQKARRAPQTHGRWAAPQEKNRVKLLYFLLTGVVIGGIGVRTAWQGRPLPFPDTAGTNGCPSHTWS